MLRATRFLVSVMAVCAVGGFSAASALAGEGPVWLVEGAKLASGKTKDIGGESTGNFKLKVGSLITILCKRLDVTGTITGGSPGTDATTLKFTECSVEGKTEAECHINNPGEATGGIVIESKSELIYIGTEKEAKEERGKLGDRFTPTSGETFVELQLNGTNCPLLTKSEQQLKGSVIAEVPLAGASKAEVKSLTFPATTINKGFQWIKSGEVKEVKAALKVFGILEAAFSGEAEITSAAGFELEKGWHAEASGGGEFDLPGEAKVVCEKETFEGVSPTSGFGSKTDMAPTYSGCQLELTKEGTTTKTKAKVEAKGCDYEFLNNSESAADEYKPEFDISNCTSGEHEGIVITDSELEAGKTCEVRMPDQALGNADKDTDTSSEGALFKAEGEIDATGASYDSRECPEGIEKGGTPSLFMVFIVVRIIIYYGYWFWF